MATLNLWGEFADWSMRLDVLRAQWDAIDADILLLQEVRRHATIDQLRDVQDALGLDYAHDVRATEVEGVAIAARHPLAPVAIGALPAATPRREAAVATMTWGSITLRIICAHVTFRPIRTQRAQIDALAGMAHGPTVLAGDFNATPDAVIARLAGYRNAVADVDTWPLITPAAFRRAWRAHVGRAPRFPLDPRQLDYIFTRDVTVLGGGPITLGPPDAPASDHALLWADIVPSSP